MVDRLHGVKAENLGTKTETRRAIVEPREVHVENWFDDLLMEEAEKFESRYEIWHEALYPKVQNT
ncbi:MAG: hypothetical protein QF579_03290 [Dehalococcoidia bacterium]|jgi:hypothetical protein|nr:hypothetical protein [Dehalococcoidia bacterium]